MLAHDADLVLEELFTNLVRHNRGTQEIEIEIAQQEGDLLLTVRDFGVEPFDPRTRRITRPPREESISIPAGGDIW